MKVCVYTAFFSQREPIHKPGWFNKIESWDYIMFTNLHPSCFDPNCSWKIHQVSLPYDQIPREPAVGAWIYSNRYYKWHPQTLLSEYDVVIYVDGLQAPDATKIGEWRRLLAELRNPNTTCTIIQSIHNRNNCIYDELNSIVSSRKDTRTRIDNLKTYLMSVGYPHNNGLYWNGCYVLDNRNDKMKRLMSDVWDDVIKFTYRDQALYMYQVWKHDAKDMIMAHSLEDMIIKTLDH